MAIAGRIIRGPIRRRLRFSHTEGDGQQKANGAHLVPLFDGEMDKHYTDFSKASRQEYYSLPDHRRGILRTASSSAAATFRNSGSGLCVAFSKWVPASLASPLATKIRPSAKCAA